MFDIFNVEKKHVDRMDIELCICKAEESLIFVWTTVIKSQYIIAIILSSLTHT